MRLLSYGEKGRERPGLLINQEEVIDLADALSRHGVELSSLTLRGFLELDNWRDLGAQIASDRSPGVRRAPSGVRIGAPITRPVNVFVVGANTHTHVLEASSLTQGRPPLKPMIMAKASTSVCGPDDPIVKPLETAKLDYETELGVIIGRQGRRIREADAPNFIAGYTAVNDVSARDVQLAEWEENTFYRTHYLGKSFDTFCPSGPHLVTADELPPLEQIKLRTRINGELRQDSDVSDLVFSVPQLVSYISSVITLQPGDLICSGSPKGVGSFMTPPGFVQSGDLVECEVSPVGTLRNRVVDERR